MKGQRTVQSSEVVDSEWVPFPGGELEGRPPKVLCADCRAKLARTFSHPAPRTGHPALRTAHSAPICFACYRATVERERALKAAGELNAGSDERFQFVLPLEPVNRSRLAQLRVERADSRSLQAQGVGRYAHKRRHAQIEARHALERIVIGLGDRKLTPEQDSAVTQFTHASELQLPEAWLPFVLAR